MGTIEKLREAVLRGDAILVIGSGVTAAASRGERFSTWSGLLDDGVTRVERDDPDHGALLRMRLDWANDKSKTSELIAIATSIREQLRTSALDKYGRWLRETVGALRSTDHELVDVIGELGLPILTTNYDTVLEHRLGRQTATWSQPDVMRSVTVGDDVAVGHLHGVWSDPSSVVFTDADYQRVTAAAAAQNVQTAAFTMKTFVFVGFGAGLEDPNFASMMKIFDEHFANTASSHFRLCLDHDVRSDDLDTVVDVGYGSDHSALPAFLRSIKPVGTSLARPGQMEAARKALLTRVRDNSTLWRDAEVLSTKSIDDLVVPPILLPEPHDQYVTNEVLEDDKSRAQPIDIDELTHSDRVIVVAGEENSGVSTAVSWLLNHVAKSKGVHPVFVDDPFGAGPKPIGRAIERQAENWGLDPYADDARYALAVDNVAFDLSERFTRAMRDLSAVRAETIILGVKQQDALEVANALRENKIDGARIVHLGRFSTIEAREIARRIAPGREAATVKTVMLLVRRKRLPRTPFTITLLTELVLNGVTLGDGDSELIVLQEYVDLLIIGDFVRERRSALNLRNKRTILVGLAKRFVEQKEDKAPIASVVSWVASQFEELGWPYDALECINDFVARRILAVESGNKIKFQRSAYLELLAGIAATNDPVFKALIFSAPLQLASIVRTYAAFAREDVEVLRIVERELERIETRPPVGEIFGGVRQLKAPNDLFTDQGQSDAASSDESVKRESNDGVSKEGIDSSYYDPSDDSDRPAFMTAQIEDLSPARVAMLVVDLASRVLRDSDEVRDQELKERILQKILSSWVAFIDLYEDDVRRAPEIDDILVKVYPKQADDEDELAALKDALIKLLPCFLSMDGIRYCLAAPTTVPLLARTAVSDDPLKVYAQAVRVIALYASGGKEWVTALSELDERAIKTWYSSVFLAALVRYAFVADETMNDVDRDKLRSFLRSVVGVRYDFNSPTQKNTVMNRFEDDLRRARLKHRGEPRKELRINM